MRLKKWYGLWSIGFGDQIPVNQLGESKNVWISGEYGYVGYGLQES